MDLHLLETFLVVCEERNLSRAAVRLFRTQPAVTRQIQALEELVGTRLLDRSPRGVRLTASGEELRLRGARLLGELRGLKDLVAGGEGLAGELNVACSDNVASHFLAPLLGRYAQAHPRVQIRLVGGVTPGIANLVERGACELGFVLLPIRSARLALTPVLRFNHVAAFARDAVPADTRSISLKALCAMPLVLLTSETATRRAFDELAAAKGLRPSRIMEVGSVAVQKAMVQAGLGAGILPDYTLGSGEGLRALPIQGARSKMLALCHGKARPLSPPAEAFMQMITARMENAGR